jgi:NTP pyrophosphatase (non-canonical NTP hydrolase)
MKMTREEYILQCLGEECVEVAHRVFKCNRFGMSEAQAGDHKDNITRIAEEVNDLLRIITLAHQEIFGFKITEEAKQAKMEKFEKYFGYSENLGIVEEPDMLNEFLDPDTRERLSD